MLRRQSFVYFWSSFQIYKVLKLDSYKGQPSKWANASAKTWVGWCEHAGLFSNNIQVSTQCQSTDSALLACLPTPCLSTFVFLLVMPKLGFETPRRGGLRTVAGQEMAKSFLEQLLRGASAGRSWTMQLRFCSPVGCLHGQSPSQLDHIFRCMSDQHQLGLWMLQSGGSTSMTGTSLYSFGGARWSQGQSRSSVASCVCLSCTFLLAA